MAKATLIEPFRGLYGKLTIKKSPNGRVIMNPAVWLWIGSSKRVRVGRLAWHPIVLEEVAAIPGLPITAAQLKPTTSIIPDCGERGPQKDRCNRIVCIAAYRICVRQRLNANLMQVNGLKVRERSIGQGPPFDSILGRCDLIFDRDATDLILKWQPGALCLHHLIILDRRVHRIGHSRIEPFDG